MVRSLASWATLAQHQPKYHGSDGRALVVNDAFLDILGLRSDRATTPPSSLPGVRRPSRDQSLAWANYIVAEIMGYAAT